MSLHGVRELNMERLLVSEDVARDASCLIFVLSIRATAGHIRACR